MTTSLIQPKFSNIDGHKWWTQVKIYTKKCFSGIKVMLWYFIYMYSLCFVVFPPQNLDVNLAVNNMLSRDDEDGSDQDGDSYISGGGQSRNKTCTDKDLQQVSFSLFVIIGARCHLKMILPMCYFTHGNTDCSHLECTLFWLGTRWCFQKCFMFPKGTYH